LHRTTRTVLGLVSISLALSYLAQRPTEATPAFAKKEGVPCGYCHLRASGGGKRNYRGKFYQAHNLSFAGFDDAAEAKAAGEEIAPSAESKPVSLTPPAAPAAETPAPAPAAVVTPANPASEGGALDKTEDATKAAETAYMAKKTDPKLKAAYGDALAAQAHQTMLDMSMTAPKRFAATVALDQKALKFSPKNKTAASDMKAAMSALKVEKMRAHGAK
jgi:hypothetical protein